MNWPRLAFLAVALPAAALSRPISVVDDLGTTVTVSGIPARVVCLSPGATEIIYKLGAEGKLVAVCSFCDYPSAARKLPQVGDFMNLSVEAIMSARPGLVVATGGVQKEVVLRLRAAGVPTIVLYPHSVKGVLDNIRILGGLLGKAGEAESLVTRLAGLMEQVSRRAKSAAGGAVVRVYFEVSSEPLMAIGGRGYLGEIIRLAGGRNIAGSFDDEYPRISAEYVINADPQVIILSHADDPARAAEEIGRRPGWSGVSAVRSGRVYADLDMDALTRPGPRLISGMADLQRMFYPGK